MKIAIMTSIKPENFGTSLQACAILRFLTDCGHDAKIVQYYPRKKNNKQRICFSVFFRARRKLYRFFHKNIVALRGKKLFDEFYEKNIRLTDFCDTDEDLKALNDEYDAFVCGSDQIWSPLGFDEHFFLDFVKEPKRMVPYAPSFGVYTIKNQYAREAMKLLLKRFRILSARESTGVKILRDEFGLEAKNVADPALLYTAKEWDEVLNLPDKIEQEPYLLAYFLGDNRKHWNKVKALAKKQNLKPKIVPVFEKDLRRKGALQESLGPMEFVNLIKNASCVCTDSFHGLLFSMIYKRKTFCFRRFKENSSLCENSRVVDILEKVGLSNRLSKGDLLCEVNDEDYITVERNIAVFANESKAYLTEALERIEQENMG